MRVLLSFLIGIVAAAVVVSLGILVAQNGQTAQLTVLGVAVRTQMGWLIAGAVGLGFVLALLLLIPGQMARAWRGWWLGRQMVALERRFVALSEQQATLQGAHQRLLAEHQQVLAHVLAPTGGPPGVPGREAAAAAPSAPPSAPAPAPAEAAAALVASPLPAGTLGAPTPVLLAAEPLPRTGPLLPPPAPSPSGEATQVSSAPAAAIDTAVDTPNDPSSTDSSSHEPG
jgi:hypothetical protein